VSLKTRLQYDKTIERLAKTGDFKTIDDLVPLKLFKYFKGLPLTLKSIQRELSGGHSFWSWLQAEDFVPLDKPSPFTLPLGKIMKASDKGQNHYVPYTPAECVRLHQAALERDDKTLADTILWGMYTGCRVEELYQLRYEDLRDGIVRILDGKTPAAKRQYPMHPKLASWLSLQAPMSPSDYVLPSTSENQLGIRSAIAVKRFSRLKTRLGFGPLHTFHSIRKTIGTIFEQAGIPEGVAADVVGHDKPTMTYGLYSGGSSMEQKRRAIETLEYPWKA
jgi:integrase